MLRDPRGLWLVGGLALLVLVPPIAAVLDEPFYPTLFARIMIFAIAAVSLDLILGYGGMVSFGHAAYLGIGGYAVAILSFYGIDNGFLQFAVAVVASASIALVIGAICLRTSGVYFIMITLAFTQMLFFFGVSIEEYGGDDGLNTNRSEFGDALDLGDDTVLYYFILAVMIFCVFVTRRIVRSRFGMAVQGARLNEARMQAIGFPTFRYKLTAFVIAGTMCGVAGALLANLTEFVTPEYMNWFRSGEIMVMVLMGGMGTLFGPLFGAAAFLLLEEVLSSLTENWMIIFGPFLVLVVLFARDGLLGILSHTGRGDD